MFPSVPETRPAPPAPCGMPSFEPLRVRGGGGGRLRRALRRQRRATAVGFALSCVVFAVSGLGGSGPGGPGPPGPPRPPDGRATAAGDARPVAEREREQRPGGLVSAPVRIADAATVALLRPGDHVDVIAARVGSAEARVVAQDVRVAEVPGRRSGDSGPDFTASEEPDGLPGPGGGGALVVLAVERGTAAALAGAGASGRLVVAVSRGH